MKVSDDNYLIEVANKDLLWTIWISNKMKELLPLLVKVKNEDSPSEYIHKGISQKKFKRVFRLSEYVHVDGVSLKDGILAITLKFELPEEKNLAKSISVNLTTAR